MIWHADSELLARYASGALDDAAAWSVEAHVPSCDLCRARLQVVPLAGEAALEGIWDGVEGELRIRRRPVERLLVALGFPDDAARLVAVTPSLTASWLLAVVVVLGFAVGSAWLAAGASGRASLLFLVVAPLVPLAGVAAAFGPRVDPTYEIGLTAPVRGSQLLALRTAAVLGTSLALAAIGALFLPSVGWSAVAWILPALAVTAAMLAASTWAPPLASGATVAAIWVGVVVLAEAWSQVTLAAFQAEGQLLAGLLLACAGAVLLWRRQRFDIEGAG